MKIIKSKISVMDIVGYILFILWLILISPFLFVRGGIYGIVKYYKDIEKQVKNF